MILLFMYLRVIRERKDFYDWLVGLRIPRKKLRGFFKNQQSFKLRK
ncbi:hypothetical protein DDD_0771 [Nonlabens dokdonensis DSW-6]|uniref:Uncharacterized protein n=1 Tax=Nonlabens dokdonensis (strain DSM 17205 / KCTC 12402 / DSW-6) TaxID=592029 RepID=L7WAJ3_NONDD|nr:hypothetical protein DDD_0771 [Nonlabens dokdonensis DSW-6]